MVTCRPAFINMSASSSRILHYGITGGKTLNAYGMKSKQLNLIVSMVSLDPMRPMAFMQGQMDLYIVANGVQQLNR